METPYSYFVYYRIPGFPWAFVPFEKKGEQAKFGVWVRRYCQAFCLVSYDKPRMIDRETCTFRGDPPGAAKMRTGLRQTQRIN